MQVFAGLLILQALIAFCYGCGCGVGGYQRSTGKIGDYCAYPSRTEYLVDGVFPGPIAPYSAPYEFTSNVVNTGDYSPSGYGFGGYGGYGFGGDYGFGGYGGYGYPGYGYGFGGYGGYGYPGYGYGYGFGGYGYPGYGYGFGGYGGYGYPGYGYGYGGYGGYGYPEFPCGPEKVIVENDIINPQPKIPKPANCRRPVNVCV